MIAFTKKTTQALVLLLIPAVALVGCTERTENISGDEQGQIDVSRRTDRRSARIDAVG